MLRLHYYPGNASLAPHVLLHEIGVPFELVLVDRTRDAHKSAAYLQLNPNGLIPVLQDGPLVLYETAAICLHLADTHPAARLAPPLGSVERAHFYKWLVWLTNTLQALLIHYFYPERLVNDGDSAAAAQVKAHAEARIATLLQQLDDQLASHGGPWPGPGHAAGRRSRRADDGLWRRRLRWLACSRSEPMTFCCRWFKRSCPRRGKVRRKRRAIAASLRSASSARVLPMSEARWLASRASSKESTIRATARRRGCSGKRRCVWRKMRFLRALAC